MPPAIGEDVVTLLASVLFSDRAVVLYGSQCQVRGRSLVPNHKESDGRTNHLGRIDAMDNNGQAEKSSH